MATKTVSRARANDIENAKRVLKALKKYAAKVLKRGATPERVKQFEALIAEAEALEKSGGRLSRDEARTRLKDLLGEFRTAADLVARGPDGVDDKGVKAMKLNDAFPENDKKLAAHVGTIAAMMEPYSDELAKNDFSKAEQAKLIKAAAAFIEELETSPVKAGEQKGATADRETVFERLRYQTNFYRRAGRAAFRTSKARADFDRVQATVVVKAKKKATTEKRAVAAKSAKKPKGKTDPTNEKKTDEKKTDGKNTDESTTDETSG